MNEEKKKKKEEKEKEKEAQEEELKNLIEKMSDSDDPEADLNNFITSLDKKLKKKNNNTVIAYMFGLLVHKNPLIHLLITLVMNFAIMYSLQGFFHFAEFDNLLTFSLSILLFTVVEFIIKIIFVRYLLKVILMTFGAIFLVLQIIYVELMYYFLPNYSFENQTMLILFVLVFTLVRYVIIRVAHTYISNILRRGEK